MKKLFLLALMAIAIPCAGQVNVQGSSIQVGGNITYNYSDPITINACGYPGTTLADKINAADAAFLFTPVNIEVSTQCTNQTIPADVFLHSGHPLRFGPGMAITMSARVLTAGTNISITGDHSTTVTLQPVPANSSCNTAGFEAANFIYEPPIGVISIVVHDITISGFNINANADAFLAAGCSSQRDRPIVISSDSNAVVSPYNITVADLTVTNCGTDCAMAYGGGGSNQTSPGVKFIGNHFSHIYGHAIRIQPKVDGAVVQGNGVTDYEIPYPLPVSSVTSSGTVATVNLSTPLPDIINTSNIPTLYVTGCSDSHYDFPYTVGRYPIIHLPIAPGATSFQYDIPAGAAPSTTNCVMQMQNQQAPYRADSPVLGLVFNQNTLSNTSFAREFGIEVFGGSPGNYDGFLGLQITNNTFDALHYDGGTGLSITGRHAVISGNRLLNGGSGQLSNGCECSLANSAVSNEAYDTGSFSMNGGSGNAISNITATGIHLGGSPVAINTSDSSVTNVSVVLGAGSVSTNGVAFGLSGGLTDVKNIVASGISVTSLNPPGGAAVACILFGGVPGSGNISLSHVTCNSTEFGIQGDGNAHIDGLHLDDIDTSLVRTAAYTLGPMTHVTQSNSHTALAQSSAQDLSGRTVYGQLAVSQITNLDSAGILVIGGGGSGSYTYFCVGKRGAVIGTPASASTSGGPNTLSSGAFNYVYCPTFQGATSTDIYRTAGGPNTGKIGSFTNNAGAIFDIGVSGDGTSPPAASNTGVLDLTGAGILSPATAPTGACPTNNLSVISADGQLSQCIAGTWVNHVLP